jgi:hypothetical protein
MLPIPEGTSSRDCWNTKLCDWLNFFFAVQRNWWDKVWNVSMAIFPFVGSRSWISLVGTAYLSICMSVWSVYFCLCTQMVGLAIRVHTFSFAVSKLVPGLVISSAILCVCLSIYVSTKLREAKLLHFWLSEILQLSSYIFDYEYVCLDG